MLTHLPSNMMLYMWTKKWLCWEFICITIHFHFFVWNISITLNMILSACSFYFTGSFSVFYLINDSMFPMISRQIFLELFCQNEMIVLCAIMHYNLWIKCFYPISWTLYIIWYIALVNGIETINHLFYMYWCTETKINYNWVTLRHNWHKV